MSEHVDREDFFITFVKQLRNDNDSDTTPKKNTKKNLVNSKILRKFVKQLGMTTIQIQLPKKVKEKFGTLKNSS